ncbi:MAG: hypothetical protein D3914_06230, partial [Candidatus Electrothrix sp. LOE2]|nr:hypothetical protein [Candidatus Electrothrix sp. LOE2]
IDLLLENILPLPEKLRRAFLLTLTSASGQMSNMVFAFQGADQVLVREIVPLTNVPVEEQFSSGQLAAALKKQGVSAEYFPDTAAILAALAKQVRSGDVVAILSNGGFDNIHEQLLGLLRKRTNC